MVIINDKPQNTVCAVPVVCLPVDLRSQDVIEKVTKHADSAASAEQVIGEEVFKGQLARPEVKVDREPNQVQCHCNLIAATEEDRRTLPSDVVLLLRVPGYLVHGTEVEPGF